MPAERYRIGCRLDPADESERVILRAYLALPAGRHEAAVRRCLDQLPAVVAAMAAEAVSGAISDDELDARLARRVAGRRASHRVDETWAPDLW